MNLKPAVSSLPDMTSTQKGVRLAIRILLPVITLGGFGSILGLVIASSSGRPFISATWSPDGRYRASIVRGPAFGRGCDAGGGTVLVIERSFLHIYAGQYTPFCLDGDPNGLAVTWLDSHTLAVECSGCDRRYAYSDANWGRLRFVYDLQRP